MNDRIDPSIAPANSDLQHTEERRAQLLAILSNLPFDTLKRSVALAQQVHPDRLRALATATEEEFAATKRLTLTQIESATALTTSQNRIAEESLKTIAAYQNSLRHIPARVERGLGWVMLMFWFQFLLGFLLVAVGAFLLITNGPSRLTELEGIMTILFGVGGLGTMLLAFATSSPMKIQKNRIDLGQFNLASFSWLNSMLAVTAFPVARAQILAHQNAPAGNPQPAGTAATGAPADPMDWETFKAAHELNLRITKETLQLIEDLCEFGDERRKPSPPREEAAEATPRPEAETRGPAEP